jgi:hypothetical protein
MKHQNIFSASETPTFATPVALFDKLLILPDVQPSAILLYVYLVRSAETPTFRMHTGTILAATGLSRHTFIAARRYLMQKDFIRCEETELQGWWHFEILGEGGSVLPTYDGYLSFAETTAEEIEYFYCTHLGLTKAPARESNGDFLFGCPFHLHSETKLPLRVQVGEKYHGHFICSDSRRCGRRGGFIEFRQAWALKQAGKQVTRDEAARAARTLILNHRSMKAEPAPTTRTTSVAEVAMI